MWNTVKNFPDRKKSAQILRPTKKRVSYVQMAHPILFQKSAEGKLFWLLTTIKIGKIKTNLKLSAFVNDPTENILHPCQCQYQ